MQRSQQEQFRCFEEEWEGYLREFQQETVRRMRETAQATSREVAEQESSFRVRMEKQTRRQSPRLGQLQDRKARLVGRKEFEEAMRVNARIEEERERLEEEQARKQEELLRRKVGKLARRTDQQLSTLRRSLQVNMDRLVAKKREGQHIMRIRIKNLSHEANRKLSQHYSTEMDRLRHSLHLAAN